MIIDATIKLGTLHMHTQKKFKNAKPNHKCMQQEHW
jgi:hypothetical protein